FAKEGAIVIVNGYPGDPVKEVVDEINRDGGKAAAFVADISTEENAKECIALAKRTYGQLDILINNAGTFPEMNEISEYSTEAFEYMLKNNVKSAFLMTRYAFPELQATKGCIVFAGSESGELGLAKNAA